MTTAAKVLITTQDVFLGVVTRLNEKTVLFHHKNETSLSAGSFGNFTQTEVILSQLETPHGGSNYSA